MTVIGNGANRPLNQNSGGVPNVGDALLEWFQPMTFGVVTKVTRNFQTVETMEEINFRGVWQPQGPRAISYKPEGQRDWKWFMLHSDPSLILEPDQVVAYLGTQYRVKSQTDYRLYGYIQYELIEDFTGSGPTPEAP